MLAKLKENILKFTKEKNFTYIQLEQEAGLHKNYISNFLAKDFTPGIDIITSIADTLHVSIDDLLGRTSTEDFVLPSDDLELDSKLMKSCVLNIDKFLKEKGRPITFNKFLFLFKEIYLYHLHRNEKEVDTKFISWFIDRV